MKIEEVLHGVRVVSSTPARLDVKGLEYDSRRVNAGFLFFAFAGANADRRSFAADAMARGAVAVVSESAAPAGFNGLWIQVEHGRKALAVAARNFYHAPDEKLGITGITGTNGKTTTSYLIDSILRADGRVTGLVGTIEYHLAGRVLKAANTTPESLDLFRMFDELLQAGGRNLTMEVSSHALALGRAYGIHFHTAVFTNLTRDHLDFHSTMDDYFAAKRLLFAPESGPPPRSAVLNFDDEWSSQIRPTESTSVYWYGLDASAEYRAVDIHFGFEGSRFRLHAKGESYDITSPLTGRHNVYNILAAICTGLSYSINMATIIEGISNCRTVPGRFERVDMGQPFLVVVDYAHTDDALRNLIAVARDLKPKRVITVFGCGGDRDRQKRPLMGMAAAQGSDFVVLTSDNPRSEDPLDIINDALVGLRRFDTPHVIEVDREKAIRKAFEEANAGDIVLIAGKGHEPYQITKGHSADFDDREVARTVLRDFGYQK
jgi:UDP-N-acetylmuramoyl-L-alanyl-D-glutamate--2,6-diaminopimelate ligase